MGKKQFLILVLTVFIANFVIDGIFISFFGIDLSDIIANFISNIVKSFN